MFLRLAFEVAGLLSMVIVGGWLVEIWLGGPTHYSDDRLTPRLRWLSLPILLVWILLRFSS